MSIKKFGVLGAAVLTSLLVFSALAGAAGSISGRVTAEQGGTVLPVLGAWVTAVERDSHFVASAPTDSGGNYRIDGLPPGSYRVVACKLNLGCLFYPGTPRPDSAELVVVNNGAVASGIDIRFRPFVPPPHPRGGLILGRITDAQTGDGIGGAEVFAKPDNLLPVLFHTSTFPNGNYALPVPPGNYNVEAVALGYQPGAFSGNPVAVDSGDTAAGVNIALSQISVDFGSISGLITDQSNGSPLEHALVVARRLNGHGYGAALTDSSGNYRIRHLPPGLYKVAALARGYFPAIYPDSVPVRPGEETSNINLGLMPMPPPDLGIISGMVTDDSTGAPLGCAVVAAVGFDSVHHHRIVRFAHTDSTGSYTIGNLPRIPYFVIAWARGYIAELYDNVHRFEDATQVTPDASGIDFVLERRDSTGHSLAGIIRTNFGTPLPGAVLEISDWNGSLSGVALALPDGGFMLEGLAPGNYSLRASADAGTSASRPVDLSGGSNANFDVALAAPSNLRGDVNSDGLYDASDVVSILNGVFLGAMSGDPLAADLDCDGLLTASDVVLELNQVFLGATAGVCGY